MLLVLLMTMATAALSASFAVFLVRERANKSKHVQTVSGAPPSAFWGSVYLWDLINYAISAAGVPASLHQSWCHKPSSHILILHYLCHVTRHGASLSCRSAGLTASVVVPSACHSAASHSLLNALSWPHAMLHHSAAGLLALLHQSWSHKPSCMSLSSKPLSQGMMHHSAAGLLALLHHSWSHNPFCMSVTSKPLSYTALPLSKASRINQLWVCQSSCHKPFCMSLSSKPLSYIALLLSHGMVHYAAAGQPASLQLSWCHNPFCVSLSLSPSSKPASLILHHSCLLHGMVHH